MQARHWCTRRVRSTPLRHGRARRAEPSQGHERAIGKRCLHRAPLLTFPAMVLPKMIRDEGSRAYPAADEAGPLSKVPRVTFAFWVVKILATTLGETGGDALSMTLKLGYAESTLIFLALFLCTLFAQVKSRHYHPAFYWAVVVATTTVGTTTSDYFDRTLGLGYVKSSIILLCLVIALLAAWRYATGAIRVDRITARKDEVFYGSLSLCRTRSAPRWAISSPRRPS